MQPVQPIGASETPAGEVAPADAMAPDNRPLSGAQPITLGTLESSFNTLRPSFRFTQMFDNNTLISPAKQGFEGVSSFSGNLALNLKRAHANTLLNYTGGGIFYSERSELNSMFHDFGLTQSFQLRRWTFSLIDQAMYSPESVLNGGGGVGGTVNPGWQTAAMLTSQFAEGQSIYTLHSSRYSNTSLVQLEYGLTNRTTMTFSGSYGLMRFTDVGFFNSNQTNGSAGVTHQFTAKDSLALNYSYDLFRFDNTPVESQNHTVRVTYGYQLTGRLSAHAGVGPQVNTISGIPGGSQQRTFVSTDAGLQYRLPRTQIGVSYDRGVGSGSGVLLGAQMDRVSADISRSIARTWQLDLNGSIARNSGLTGNTSFTSGLAGLSVRRSLGRMAGLFFSYSFQRQVSDTPCTGLLCLNDLSRHVFSFGFDWQYRPIRIE